MKTSNQNGKATSAVARVAASQPSSANPESPKAAPPIKSAIAAEKAMAFTGRVAQLSQNGQEFEFIIGIYSIAWGRAARSCPVGMAGQADSYNQPDPVCFPPHGAPSRPPEKIPKAQ